LKCSYLIFMKGKSMKVEFFSILLFLCIQDRGHSFFPFFISFTITISIDFTWLLTCSHLSFLRILFFRTVVRL
jgi:hypothetical protein